MPSEIARTYTPLRTWAVAGWPAAGLLVVAWLLTWLWQYGIIRSTGLLHLLFFIGALAALSSMAVSHRRAARANDALRELVQQGEQAQEALRDSGERYRLLFEHHPQPMWVMDEATMRFLAVNEAAICQYGYLPEEFLSMTIDALRAPDDPCPDESHETTRTCRHRKKDGAVIDVEVTAHRLPFKGRSVRLVSAVDVTARKRLEEQIRQVQKMEAVGTLAGGIAHDFNNLLTAIRGFGALLADGLPPDHPLRDYADQVNKAADKAACLTRQLLAFSRRQVLRPEPVNLNTLIADLDCILRRLIGEVVKLVVFAASKLGRIWIDPVQIEQVLVNIAVNARDAMPQGGKLIIRTLDIDIDEQYAARFADLKPGAYVLLAISDTGTGMPPEVQSHIFEPFYTTKDVGKGTGLGLSMVYGIVKQSGGHISVHSTPGQGTTFQIYLPRAEGPPAPSSEEASAATEQEPVLSGPPGRAGQA